MRELRRHLSQQSGIRPNSDCQRQKFLQTEPNIENRPFCRMMFYLTRLFFTGDSLQKLSYRYTKDIEKNSVINLRQAISLVQEAVL
eukprot:5960936-Amphidinium_carterae.1